MTRCLNAPFFTGKMTLKMGGVSSVVSEIIDNLREFQLEDWLAENAAAEGVDQTGVQYIVAPPGGTTLSRTTAARIINGDAVDGAEIDPIRTGGTSQGYDQRISQTWDGARSASFPATLTPGQVLVRSRSLDPVVGDDGFFESFSALHVVSRAPTSNEILPSAIGWSGRGTPTPLPFNAAARLAELETYDATGLVFPAFETLMAALDKYPLIFAQNTGTNSGSGYERNTPSGAPGFPGVGYSFSVARVQVMALFALTADPSPYTPAQRLELYRKIVRIGVDMVDAILASGIPTYPDGGHSQTAIAFGIEALRATGRSDQIAGFRAAFGGSLDQYFRIDQAYVDTHMTPHTNIENGCLYRLRTLGAQPGGTTLSMPARYGGSGGVHGDWHQIHIPAGAIVTRQGDGATAVVTSPTAFPTISGAERNTDVPFNVPIDAQPTPAFAPGDVIYIQWPPGSWSQGSAAWALRGLARPSYVTPSPENAYTSLRTEGAQALWLDMQGILPENMRDILDFAGWADDDASGWPKQWGNGAFGLPDPAQHVWRRVLNMGSADVAGYSQTVIAEEGAYYSIQRFNVDNILEVPEAIPSADYLIVAGGGGGGGNYRSGGGGAGGVLSGTTSLSPGSFPITIGAGGSGGVDANTLATSGGDSTFAGLVATGGGAGGRLSGTAPSTGGSGGGGGPDVSGASGTSGQGNAGGAGLSSPSFMGQGGGGGGAGAVGGNASTGQGGDGGIGFLSNITGAATYFGGGGGGGVRASDGGTPGTGGQGGGGTGGFGSAIDEASTVGTDGVFGTGGGGGAGGGGGSGTYGQGGAGGSGTVIVRYEITEAAFLAAGGEIPSQLPQDVLPMTANVITSGHSILNNAKGGARALREAAGTTPAKYADFSGPWAALSYRWLHRNADQGEDVTIEGRSWTSWNNEGGWDAFVTIAGLGDTIDAVEFEGPSFVLFLDEYYSVNPAGQAYLMTWANGNLNNGPFPGTLSPSEWRAQFATDQAVWEEYVAYGNANKAAGADVIEIPALKVLGRIYDEIAAGSGYPGASILDLMLDDVHASEAGEWLLGVIEAYVMFGLDPNEAAATWSTGSHSSTTVSGTVTEAQRAFFAPIIKNVVDNGYDLTFTPPLAAPSISGVPTHSGTAQVGQTLTITPAAVSGNPTPTRTLDVVGDGTFLAEGVGTSFVIPAGAEGERLTVVQTETNSEGSPSASSTQTAVVAAPPAGGTYAENQVTTLGTTDYVNFFATLQDTYQSFTFATRVESYRALQSYDHILSVGGMAILAHEWEGIRTVISGSGQNLSGSGGNDPISVLLTVDRAGGLTGAATVILQVKIGAGTVQTVTTTNVPADDMGLPGMAGDSHWAGYLFAPGVTNETWGDFFDANGAMLEAPAINSTALVYFPGDHSAAEYNGSGNNLGTGGDIVVNGTIVDRA